MVRIILGFGCCLFLAGTLCVAESKLPEGTIREGSLANGKLIQDTKIGVAAKLASSFGCSKPEAARMFVVQLPEGEPGSRSWKERWIVRGCDKDSPIDIEFRESGLGAADYFIR